MNIRILSLAENDLLTGYRFYERQADGIGSYFLDTLYSEIESLRLYAGTHRRVQGYFRLISRRFPYAIYYQLEGHEIQVWRVLDCRKNPQTISQQLE